MHVVAILGHSFVYGLEHHLRNKNFFSPADMAVALNLNLSVEQVFFFGCRQSCITRPDFTLPMDGLRNASPSIVILNYGTNDLAQDVPPPHVASKLMDTAQGILTSLHSVRHVMIFGAIDRICNIPSFRSRVEEFNTLLFHRCNSEVNISFMTLRGFWGNDFRIWSRDNCHPNTPRGRQLYISTIRTAVLTCISTINTGQKKSKRRRRKRVAKS